MKKVNLYVNLNIIALRNQLTAPYRIWLLLRLFDKEGKGYVDYKKFIKFLQTFELSYNHFYTALYHKESQLFFSYLENANIIEYRSVANVCKVFDVKPGKYIQVNRDIFTTLRKFSAYCYAGLFSDKPKNMSRDYIESLTGVSKQTQITYEKIVGVKVVANVANYQWSDKERYNPELRYNRESTLPCVKNLAENHKPYHKITNNGVYWQTTNTYSVTKDKILHIRKLPSANVRVKNKVSNEGVAIMGEHAGLLPKRIYLDNVPNMKKIFFTENGDSLIKTNRIGYVTQSNNKQQSAVIHRYNPYGITTKKEGSIPYAFVDNNFNVVIPDYLPNQLLNTPIVNNQTQKQVNNSLTMQTLTETTTTQKYKPEFLRSKERCNRHGFCIYDVKYQMWSRIRSIPQDSILLSNQLDNKVESILANYNFKSQQELDDFIYFLIDNTIELEDVLINYGKQAQLAVLPYMKGHGLHLLDLEKLLVS